MVDLARVLIVGGVYVTIFNRKVGPLVIGFGACLLAASPLLGHL